MKNKKQSGKVLFFDNLKGWGMVEVDTGEPLFVHHRDIVDKRFFPKDAIDKFRTLKAGQHVDFFIKETDKPMNSATELEITDG